MLRCGNIEITGGFLLLAATLYYLDGQGVLFWAASACLLHELGHLSAIYALGGRVARLRLSISGAEMTLSAARNLDPCAQMLAALAGPVSNLALAVLSTRLVENYGETWFLFAGLNLSLAAFNLLPMAQLDGGRALYWLVTLLWSQRTAQRIVTLTSKGTAVALLLCGTVLLYATKTNFTLFVTAFWLTASLFAAKRRRKPHTSTPRNRKKALWKQNR